MPKEVLLYKRIESESAIEFIEEMNELDKQEEITGRVNGPGGNPEYGFGMIAKWSEHTGPKKLKIDGMAYSMHMMFALYAADVECLDVTELLAHRAAYPEWFENSDYFTEPLRENLVRINASLEKAFRAKIDVEAFENLKQVKEKGITVKSLFSMEGRQDVFLSAKDAKKIGLVNKITAITPKITAEISVIKEALGIKIDEPVAKKEEPISNNENMLTLAELKEKHPSVYAEAIKLGVEQGIAEEKDRVGSIMAFSEIDPVECKKIVESGKKLSETDRSNFTLKAIAKTALKDVSSEAAEVTPTGEQPVKLDPKKVDKNAEKVEAFNKDLMSQLNIKPEDLDAE